MDQEQFEIFGVRSASIAVEAMVLGLQMMQKHKSFRVNMNFWLMKPHDEEICHGCAAASALFYLSGANVEDVKGSTSIDDRLRLFFKIDDLNDLGYSDYNQKIAKLDNFELAIDELRKGDAITLIRLFHGTAGGEKAIESIANVRNLRPLSDDFTDEDLEPYSNLVPELRALGM